MTKVNIEGMDWAAVLACLFNHTKPYGMGVNDPLAHVVLTVDQAQGILDSVKVRHVTDLPVPGQPSVGPGGGVDVGSYLYGHSLGLVFDGDRVDVVRYDRDNRRGHSTLTGKQRRHRRPRPRTWFDRSNRPAGGAGAAESLIGGDARQPRRASRAAHPC